MKIEEFIDFSTDLIAVAIHVFIGFILMLILCVLPLFGACYVVKEILNVAIQ